MRKGEVREYYVKEYEDFIRAEANGERTYYSSIWNLAKYNPYAAYMLASSMEKGEMRGHPGGYYRMSAEMGCSRALWKFLEDPGEGVGIRELCGTYNSCAYGQERDPHGYMDFRSDAARRAEENPVIWTMIAFGDFCKEDWRLFDDSSKKAVAQGDPFACYLRGCRMLQIAEWSTSESEATRLAREGIDLLRRASDRIWEARRLLGEELWTGRWVPREAEEGTRLILSTTPRSPMDDDYWREYLGSPPNMGHDGSAKGSLPGDLGRIGRRSCGHIVDSCEWRVLMRVTYTNGWGITSMANRRGRMGGYENDVFVLNPWREEHPAVPFLEFKPSGVKLFDPVEPFTNADMDEEDVRMMLRICIDSVTGAV